MKKLYRGYLTCLLLMTAASVLTLPVYAVDDMWTIARTIIVDVYNGIGAFIAYIAPLFNGLATLTP